MSTINTNYSVSGYSGMKVNRETEKKAQETSSASVNSAKQDGFTPSETTTNVTYTKQQLTKTQANQLLVEAEARVNSFREMIQKMLAQQGEASNLTLFGLQLNVTPADSAKAAQSIAEGGEYSVDAVAGRIMDMAKALSGGDPSKISVLRDAVQKGFGAAGKDFGSKLPDICGRTYDEVMKRFDDWENGE